MTGAQVREARHLLGLSTYKLARLCGLPFSAIRYFEATGLMHRSIAGGEPEDRLAVVRSALEVAGIVFTEDEEPGVKLRKVEA